MKTRTRPTPYEAHALEAIKAYWDEHGYAPSRTDIAKTMGGTVGGIQNAAHKLESMGLIKMAKRAQRTTTLTERGRQYLKRMVS